MQKEWHRATKTLVNTEIQKENQDDVSKETQPKFVAKVNTATYCRYATNCRNCLQNETSMHSCC